jgi:acyl-CoA synthetase (NDP forming)
VEPRVTHRLAPLMAPRSVAVLGASADLTRIGGVPVKCLLDWGFAGPLYPVNPRYGEVGGLRCYPDLESLPEPVDLAILAVGAELVLDGLRRAAARGVRAALVYASDFEESGDPAGTARGAALAAFAAETGMPVCGPNCMGGANVADRVYTSFVASFVEAPRGEVAVLAQSGNMSSTVYRLARQAGLGFSHIVNTGNESCVEFAEYLDYLLDDPATGAVIGYVEGLRNGPRFLRAARAFRERGKLLALFKAGRTAKGAEAARSHTAALAGDARAFEAACRAAGLALAEDLQHLIDLAYLHRHGRGRRAGRNAAVITVSGAAGAVLADGLTARGMALPPLPEESQAALRRAVPSYGMIGNPVDTTGNVMNSIDNFRAVLSAVLAAPAIDSLLLYVPSILLPRALPHLAGAAAATDKLLVAVDTANAEGNRAAAEGEGLAYFADMTWCARALAGYAEWRASALPATPAGTPAEPPPEGALALLRAAREAGAAQLGEAEGKRLLAAFGIAPVPEALARTPEEAAGAAARLGWPVVAKIASPDIAHKTEVGGVRLGLRGAAALAAAFAEILDGARRHAPAARVEGVSIQPQIADGVEVLLGATRDPVFGWMLTLGLGGVWTELMGDVRHALAPISAAEAEAMLRGLRGFPLLDGHRGRPKADLAAAAEAAAALSRAVLALGDEVSELEVNPLLVRPARQGAVAADALVVLPSG